MQWLFEFEQSFAEASIPGCVERGTRILELEVGGFGVVAVVFAIVAPSLLAKIFAH